MVNGQWILKWNFPKSKISPFFCGVWDKNGSLYSGISHRNSNFYPLQKNTTNCRYILTNSNNFHFFVCRRMISKFFVSLLSLSINIQGHVSSEETTFASNQPTKAPSIEQLTFTNNDPTIVVTAAPSITTISGFEPT